MLESEAKSEENPLENEKKAENSDHESNESTSLTSKKEVLLQNCFSEKQTDGSCTISPTLRFSESRWHRSKFTGVSGRTIDQKPMF